jgi:hypothetical protein
MICWGSGLGYCEETCTLNDRSHPCLFAGAICTLVLDQDARPQVPPVPLCNSPCKSDLYCPAPPPPGTARNCTCQLTDLPDAPAGTCRDPSGGAICPIPITTVN